MFLLLFLFPIFAWAQEALPPESIEEVVSFIPALMAAIKSSNWLAVGAIVTVILCFLIKKYLLPKIGLASGVMPLVSIVVGILAGVGMAVIGGASPQAAAMAALSGPLASSLWDALIKYFFKK